MTGLQIAARVACLQRGARFSIGCASEYMQLCGDSMRHGAWRNARLRFLSDRSLILLHINCKYSGGVTNWDLHASECGEAARCITDWVDETATFWTLEEVDKAYITPL
jgi:hypothetical protein